MGVHAETGMTDHVEKRPGICPICSASVQVGNSGGIWTGSMKSKARNGPLYHATCKACRSMLTASPTYEEAEAGVFIWEFWKKECE